MIMKKKKKTATKHTIIIREQKQDNAKINKKYEQNLLKK